jgi:hypothetical protein
MGTIFLWLHYGIACEKDGQVAHQNNSTMRVPGRERITRASSDNGLLRMGIWIGGAGKAGPAAYCCPFLGTLPY